MVRKECAPSVILFVSSLLAAPPSGYAQGLALVAGEYGIGVPGGSTEEATRSLVRVGYSRKVGRSVWHWTGGDENDLTTSNSGRSINKTDGSKPTNLTWLGGVVWDDNHSGATRVDDWGIRNGNAVNRAVTINPAEKTGRLFDIRGALLDNSEAGMKLVIIPARAEKSQHTQMTIIR